MPTLPLDTTGRTWTYGAEHELADWDTRLGWEGYGRDPEPNIVNSNGIAADGTLKSYPFGGEINTPPTDSIEAQVELFEKFLKKFPRAVANYRTGLHVHIRVPGLRENLEYLKKLQWYITNNVEIYQLIDPIPMPERREFKTEEEYRGARKRAFWMRMSHHTMIPVPRVEKQLKATTAEEFFRLEVPASRTGKTLWHAQPRAAISLRQLLDTDTIEFRHYVATTNPEEVFSAIMWCRDYLLVALTPSPSLSATAMYVANGYRRVKFPLLSEYPYSLWREKRWLATTVSKRPREEVDENIRRILRGEFDEIDNSPYDYLHPTKTMYASDPYCDQPSEIS